MDDCIEFKGARDANGYGKLRVSGSFIGAHRLAYRLFNGPLRATEHVRHVCDNPACINPKHLLKGTRSENMLDAVQRGRHFNAAKTVCPAGHEYSEENTRYDKTGGRVCRKCNAAAVARYAAKKKENVR